MFYRWLRTFENMGQCGCTCRLKRWNLEESSCRLTGVLSALYARRHTLEDAEVEVFGLAKPARAGEAVLKEKVAQWRGAVERMTEGEAVSEEDIQVKEAKLVERVVDGIFAFER